MPNVTDRITKEEYVSLVRIFPLITIRDDAHLDEALTHITRLAAHFGLPADVFIAPPQPR